MEPICTNNKWVICVKFSLGHVVVLWVVITKKCIINGSFPFEYSCWWAYNREGTPWWMRSSKVNSCSSNTLAYNISLICKTNVVSVNRTTLQFYIRHEKVLNVQAIMSLACIICSDYWYCYEHPTASKLLRYWLLPLIQSLKKIIWPPVTKVAMHFNHKTTQRRIPFVFNWAALYMLHKCALCLCYPSLFRKFRSTRTV